MVLGGGAGLRWIQTGGVFRGSPGCGVVGLRRVLGGSAGGERTTLGGGLPEGGHDDSSQQQSPPLILKTIVLRHTKKPRELELGHVKWSGRVPEGSLPSPETQKALEDVGSLIVGPVVALWIYTFIFVLQV